MYDVSQVIVAIQEIFTFKIFLLLFVGMLVGVIMGSLPGLTTTMAVSLLITFTWGMPWVEAIVLIIAVHVGGTYGGATSAIFLNIPGTPASAATALDGYPMAQRGEGGLARGLATVQSAVGTLFASFLFLAAAPFLAGFSLNFGSWEYFLLALFGIIISANLAAESFLKGLIAGCIGLMLATVGMDAISGEFRFTFGQNQLLDGFNIIAVLIGLFGISEVIKAIMDLKPPLKWKREKWIIPSWSQIRKYIPLGWRSSMIGSFIGVIPGVGADVASWVSYDMAKRRSKSPETFGKGNVEGVVAAETAGNACVPGSYIPMLTLGIPGDAVTAVILGGFMLHGLNPGPLLTTQQPGIIYQFFVILLLCTLALLVVGLIFSSFFERVLLIPKSIVLVIVSVLCVIGTYAVNNSMFDVMVMFAFGLVGYLMRIIDIPAPPLVLGAILGPMAEQNFRRAMVSGDFSFLPFITRPICIILLLIILFILLSQNKAISEKLKRLKSLPLRVLGGNKDV